MHSFWLFDNICLILPLILIICWYLFNTCTYSEHLYLCLSPLACFAAFGINTYISLQVMITRIRRQCIRIITNKTGTCLMYKLYNNCIIHTCRYIFKATKLFLIWIKTIIHETKLKSNEHWYHTWWLVYWFRLRCVELWHLVVMLITRCHNSKQHSLSP